MAPCLAQKKQEEKLADCLDRLRKLFQSAQQAAGEPALLASAAPLGCPAPAAYHTPLLAAPHSDWW